MIWWEQFHWLLAKLLPKHYPLPTLDASSFEEQAARRAKQLHRWCETCNRGFCTTSEFRDHNVRMHY